MSLHSIDELLAMPRSDDLNLVIEQHYDDDTQYVARWASSGDPVVSYIPEAMWDIIGFMAARRLMEQGMIPRNGFCVRLAGADFTMMDCTLGQAAATPVINFAAPVSAPASVIYRRKTTKQKRGKR